MARGKRAEAVAAAPVEGQWALPDDWRWERLGVIAEVNPKTNLAALPPNSNVTFLPMAAVSEESGLVDTSTERPVVEVSKGFMKFRSGDVLFAKITPCMENGKVAVVPTTNTSFCAGSTEFHVVRSEALDPKFIFYYLVQRGFRQEARRNMSGSAGQLRVPTEYLRNVPIPVPPAGDQRRIVAHIDALFAEIEEGEQALAEARAGVETYRKALLKAAVSGELTADWRSANYLRENGSGLRERIFAARRARGHRFGICAEKPDDKLGKLPPQWCWSSLGELFAIAVGTTPSRADKSLRAQESPHFRRSVRSMG